MLHLFYTDVKNLYVFQSKTSSGKITSHSYFSSVLNLNPFVETTCDEETVRKWSQEAGLFCDVDALCQPNRRDIHDTTESVTDTLTVVRCFPKNKPWFTSELKELLSRKKININL